MKGERASVSYFCVSDVFPCMWAWFATSEGSVCEDVSRQAKKCYKSISPKVHVVDNGLGYVGGIWNDISKGCALSIHWHLHAMSSMLQTQQHLSEMLTNSLQYHN